MSKMKKMDRPRMLEMVAGTNEVKKMIRPTKVQVMRAAMDNLDMSKLTDKERRRIERVLHPHDTMFSHRVPSEYLDAWREAAARSGVPMVVWLCESLNAAAAK